MDKPKGTSSTVTHTDTATGKGGGRMTGTPDPQVSGSGQGNADENSKSEDSMIPARKPGQDPQDVADRMGSTGAGLGISPKPTGG